MYETFIEQAVKGHATFVILDDRFHYLDYPASEVPAGPSLEQHVADGSVFFPLSEGIEISDLERDDYLLHADEIRNAQTEFIKDQMDRDRGRNEIERHWGRYQMLRFIVGELLPRMVAAPLEERVEASLAQKEIPTGEEIVREALGQLLDEKNIEIQLNRKTAERIAKEYGAAPAPMAIGIPNPSPSSSRELSVFGMVTGNRPMMVIGGKIYLNVADSDGAELVLHTGEIQLGYFPIPFDYKGLFYHYRNSVAHQIRREAAQKLLHMLSDLDEVRMKDVTYFPLMDLDEFWFRDVGFFRNGDIYYVCRRIPKFARQTTFDEGLFVPKPYDEGFAGELGIGLRYSNGIKYLGYHEQEGGVVYRGPIKEDAPFQSTVYIVDPVMRSKHGDLRTICHVGGYPAFPMSPEGFIDFHNYARTNFLDSHRKDFADRHFDQQDRAQLLDKGQLLTREQAEAQGYMLTNIHRIR